VYAEACPRLAEENGRSREQVGKRRATALVEQERLLYVLIRQMLQAGVPARTL
jgi:hypothetical protein